MRFPRLAALRSKCTESRRLRMARPLTNRRYFGQRQRLIQHQEGQWESLLAEALEGVPHGWQPVANSPKLKINSCIGIELIQEEIPNRIFPVHPSVSSIPSLSKV